MEPQERNATAVRQCVDLFNKGIAEWVDTFYAESAEWTELPTPSAPQGRRGDRSALREKARQDHVVFPDRRMEILNLVAQGDQVVLEVDCVTTGQVGPIFQRDHRGQGRA